MSTKTNFKRIALVAVAALGLGVLSSVPSQATQVGATVVTTTNGTATLTTSDTTTAATISARFFAEAATDTVAITFSLGSTPTGAAGDSNTAKVTAIDTALASGGASTLNGYSVNKGATAVGTAFTVANWGLDSGFAGTTVATIVPAGAGYGYGKFGLHLDSSTVRLAGTYVIDYIVRSYANTGIQSTLTQSGSVSIVVSDGTLAATGVTVTAAGTSTAVMTASGTGTGDDSGLKAVITPTGTAIGLITVTQKTTAGLPARESVTVSTNIGNLGTSTSAQSGKKVTFIGGTNGVNTVYIFADGTSGTATITVATTSVTFSNKSVVFYSTSVDKITAVQLGKTLGGSGSAVIAATATDAAGNQIIANSSVYAYSSDLTVINTGATTGTECTYNSTLEVHLCSLTGSNDGTATITLRNKSTVALSTKASSAVSVVVNTKDPVSLKLAFDKATYAPGEAAYISLWAVDASGKPVAPAVARTNLLASGGITANVSWGNGTVTDSLTVNSISPTFGFTTTAGRGFASQEPIYLAKVFMPASGGAVKISATGGALLPLSGQVAVTATATVTDSAAAALAAVTALATTVASLKTLITTLTNLVLKIQKKVKA